jgi:citrate synthase
LEGIVLTETRLSHVDGARGQLLIAGFSVDELALHATFEDVLFLLWHGRLPSAAEREELTLTMAAERALPPLALDVLRAAARRTAPVMDALRMVVAMLSLIDAHPDAHGRDAEIARAQALVARFPTIVAAYWRLRNGREPIEPASGLSHAANYLFMLRGKPAPAESVRALETYLNTVVDHGMNASTFTARVITSTRSDMVSALTGAVGALKGPLHGGAPGPALDMVFDIRARAARSGRTLAAEAESWAREAISSGARLMGFGHRVYKVRDPRADVLAKAADVLFRGAEDRALYEDARTVEGALLRALHELKPGRKLETNVEFYTALVLHGVGLDAELFSPTFAIARAGGWTAHVLEQMAEDHLIRPDVAYVGARDLHWMPTEAAVAIAHQRSVNA